VANYLLQDRSGALAELGVDGIVIAQEIVGDPPDVEWQFAFANEEARVFHRRGVVSDRVRSVNWIDSRPDHEFATATLSRIDESRNRVEADVDVPSGNTSALLKFSRPYFSGYVARLGRTKLPVDSYRGLFPMVEVPAGSHGHLVLSYRPWWLFYGGGLSILSGAIVLSGALIAMRTRPK
jgi:hypothetical protein